MPSFSSSLLESNFFLNAANSIVHQYVGLLQVDFLLDQLLVLLFEEVHLINVGVLCLVEVVFEVGDVPAYLLEQLVEILVHLMLEGGALASQDLRVTLVVLQVLVQQRRVVLHKRVIITQFIQTTTVLTVSEPTRCIIG